VQAPLKVSALSPLLLATIIATSLVTGLANADMAWAQQTRWEFVPGSRQARLVPVQQGQQGQQVQSGQPGAQPYLQPGQTAPQGQQGATYYRPAARGGMQLHRQQVYSQQQYQQQPQQQARPQTQQQSTQSQSQSSQKQTQTNAASKGKSYDYADSISIDGLNRTYRVHIPACYDRSRPTPVVLAFHGLGMNSMAMLGMSGFNGLSERKNFIVVYGDGVGNRWQDPSSSIDDIGYVAEVLKKLARVANIDQRRIYACGISNGGYFTQRLACAMPDKIAAIGVVASTMIASAGNMSGGRMPAIFFLGTDDPLLPWADGRSKELGKLGETLGLSGLGSIDGPMARMGGVMSVPETINFWAGHNGCAGSPSVSSMPNTNARDGTTVKKETYGSGDVTLYVIDGGGHTWPGMIELSTVKDICGVTCQDIDASELMWDYFQRYTR